MPLRHLLARTVRAAAFCAPAALLVPALLLVAGCSEPPFGELLRIQDDQHRIAHPGKLGASATGSACGVTEREALTSARRVAQFNLRSLTGQARYLVHYELLGTTHEDKRVCVEVSALAVEPRPYNR